MAQHYMRFGRYDAAISQFENSKDFEVESELTDAIYHHGRAHLELTNIKEANDVVNERKNTDHHKSNLLECDCLFEANEFEKSLACNYNHRNRVVQGHKTDDFQNRIDMIEEIMSKTVGSKASDCLVKQRKTIPMLKNESEIDLRPLWKKRRDNNECDVVSYEDIDESPSESIKEQIHKDKNFNFLARKYLGPAAKNLFFLRELKKHNAFILPQATGTDHQLESITKSCHDKIMKNLQMIHARNPIYSSKKTISTHSDSKNCAKQRTFYMKMYLNRREAFKTLDLAKQLRNERKFNELLRYTDKILNEFYQMCTVKEFPRKFEFVTELCNNVALAYIDKLRIPSNSMMVPLNEKMAVLFNVKIMQDNFDDVEYEFGNKSTFRDPLKVDTSFIIYREKKTHLEQRLTSAKYGIEEIYILHEIARHELINDKLDDCKVFARRCEERSCEIGSHIYKFLAILMQLKAEILATNIEKQSELLKKLEDAVTPLKSEELNQIIQIAVQINELQLEGKQTARNSI
uniref:CSON011564 protein n=1 Tax=Culicoides sonorensis TaxID=179676 RepID=A0A336M7M5_CULSO